MAGPIEITIGDEIPLSVTTGTSVGFYVDADALPTYRIYATTGGATSDLVASGSFVKLDDANTVGAYFQTLTCAAATYTASEPCTVYEQAIVGGKTACDSWTFIPRTYDDDSVQTAVAAVGATATLILTDTNAIAAAQTTAVNLVQINGVAQRASDLAEFAKYEYANAATLTDIIADDSVRAQSLAISGHMADYDSIDDSQESLRSISDGTNATVLAILADTIAMQGATFTTTTDSLEAIRNRGDAAWITGGGGAGAYSYDFTVNNGTTVVEGATVLASSTASVAGLIRQGNTDSLGKLTLNFSATGSYYYKILPTTGLEESAWTAFTVTA